MPSNIPIGDSYIERKIFAVVLGVVVLFAATALLKAAAYGQIIKLALIIVCGVFAAWTFLARKRWWLMLPAGVSFGGYFWFGFKIIVHEIGLLLCLLPLLLSLATAPSAMRQRRFSLSPGVYALTGYLMIHLGFSAFLAETQHLGGLGSILRVYMHGIWPLAFMIPFYYFGSSEYLKQALLLMYLAAFLRVILGSVALAYPDILYIPGVNFVLPATASGGTDLRVSSLFLASFSMCYFAMTRRLVLKLFHALVALGSAVMVLLGAGRIGMLMFLGYVFFFLAIQRYRFTLAVTAITVALVVGAVNVNSEVLYSFPAPMRRTLSVLVLGSRYQSIHRETRLSNEWHFELARKARRRWLESGRSFAFGHRVMPYSAAFHARSATFFSRLEIAAQMGTYESGLWTVLAVTGATGFLLYAWVIVYLCRGPTLALWHSGIVDYPHAFYFLAALHVTVWIVFSWIAGHFPGAELMLAAIAKATYDGEKRREIDAAASPPPELAAS